jgi:hypothetical protein
MSNSEKNPWAVSKIDRDAFRKAAKENRSNGAFGGQGIQHDLKYVRLGEHTAIIIGFAQRADNKLFLHVQDGQDKYRVGVPEALADWAADEAEVDMEIRLHVQESVIQGEMRKWATMTEPADDEAPPSQERRPYSASKRR